MASPLPARQRAITSTLQTAASALSLTFRHHPGILNDNLNSFSHKIDTPEKSVILSFCSPSREGDGAGLDDLSLGIKRHPNMASLSGDRLSVFTQKPSGEHQS
jgi:hypothetical protein